MSDFFPAALTIIKGIEKPYSNDPNDPGGETKWGVARNYHAEITAAKWVTWTEADSDALYRSAYWDAHRCGEMPWHWALGVFDCEVNQGSAIRFAQEALGVAADGVVGPATLAAMRGAVLPLFDDFLALRSLAYARDADFPHYGKRWLARVARIARAAAIQPLPHT